MASLNEAQIAFIHENPFIGILTTLRPDGSPHSTPVWIDTEGEDVVFNTAEGRAKVNHVAADGRVSMVIVDPANSYQWISVSGEATLDAEGARKQIDDLSLKYLGKEEYPWYGGETRLTGRIKVDKVDSLGFEPPSEM